MIRPFFVSVLALAGTAFAAESAPAIASLTYSGEQTAVEALDQRVNAAGQDKAKLDALESELLGLLRRNDLTFTAKQTVAQRLGWVLAINGAKANASAYKPLAAMLLDERDSELARLVLDPTRDAVFDQMLADAAGKTSGRTRLGILDSLARRRARSSGSAWRKKRNSACGNITEPISRPSITRPRKPCRCATSACPRW